MSRFRVLDLFSGIGGFSLGLERTGGFETVAFCEIEKYPQKVLAKLWPGIYIHNDVRTLSYHKSGDEPNDWILYDSEADHEIYRGAIDVITGGFPCQDISKAGNQAGIEGTRSGLWSECARLLGELRPQYAIFENVTALISGDNGRWFEQVLWDISQVGYDAEWHCIPASELGAHHHRDRIWIIAYPNGQGSQERQLLTRIPRQEGLHDDGEDTPLGGARFAVPGVVRRLHGIPSRTHRIKALGNAVIPQIPELIGRAILEANCPHCHNGKKCCGGKPGYTECCQDTVDCDHDALKELE